MITRLVRSAAFAGLLLAAVAAPALACQGGPIELRWVAKHADAIGVVVVTDVSVKGEHIFYTFRPGLEVKGHVPSRVEVQANTSSECAPATLVEGEEYVIEYRALPGRGETFDSWAIAEDGTVTAAWPHDRSPLTLGDLIEAYEAILADLPDTATAPVPPSAAPVTPDAPSSLPVAAGWLLPAGLGLVLACRRTRRPSAPGTRVHQA